MNVSIYTLIFFLLSIFSINQPLFAKDGAVFRAIVVGVTDYNGTLKSDPPLKLDSAARLMQIELKKIARRNGFQNDKDIDIQLFVDVGETDGKPTRSKFLNTLQIFSTASKKSDWLVVYFTGHGTKPKLYFSGSYPQLEGEHLEIKKIESIIKKSKAKKKVVILDACRSLDAEAALTVASGISASKHLGDIEKGEAWFLSTEDGAVSYIDKSVGYSYYTKYLISGLKKYGGSSKLTGQELGNYLKNTVSDASINSKIGLPQIPYDKISSGFTFWGVEEKVDPDPILSKVIEAPVKVEYRGTVDKMYIEGQPGEFFNERVLPFDTYILTVQGYTPDSDYADKFIRKFNSRGWDYEIDEESFPIDFWLWIDHTNETSVHVIDQEIKTTVKHNRYERELSLRFNESNVLVAEDYYSGGTGQIFLFVDGQPMSMLSSAIRTEGFYSDPDSDGIHVYSEGFDKFKRKNSDKIYPYIRYGVDYMEGAAIIGTCSNPWTELDEIVYQTRGGRDSPVYTRALGYRYNQQSEQGYAPTYLGIAGDLADYVECDDGECTCKWPDGSHAASKVFDQLEVAGSKHEYTEFIDILKQVATFPNKNLKIVNDFQVKILGYQEGHWLVIALASRFHQKGKLYALDLRSRVVRHLGSLPVDLLFTNVFYTSDDPWLGFRAVANIDRLESILKLNRFSLKEDEASKELWTTTFNNQVQTLPGRRVSQWSNDGVDLGEDKFLFDHFIHPDDDYSKYKVFDLRTGNESQVDELEEPYKGAHWDRGISSPGKALLQTYLIEVAEPLENLTLKQVQDLQQALNVLGFRVGKVDGIIGSQTRKAISVWMRMTFNADSDSFTEYAYENLLSAAKAVVQETEGFDLGGSETKSYWDGRGIWQDRVTYCEEFTKWLYASKTIGQFSYADTLTPVKLEDFWKEDGSSLEIAGNAFIRRSGKSDQFCSVYPYNFSGDGYPTLRCGRVVSSDFDVINEVFLQTSKDISQCLGLLNAGWGHTPKCKSSDGCVDHWTDESIGFWLYRNRTYLGIQVKLEEN